MIRPIALIAGLVLIIAACGGGAPAAPTPPPDQPPAAQTPAAEAPSEQDPPPALGTAELEALAREFVPPAAVQQSVFESTESYQIHMSSQMSLGDLEAHWRQVAANSGMSIESVMKTDDVLQINLAGHGTSYGWVMAMTGASDTTVSIVMGTD